MEAAQTAPGWGQELFFVRQPSRGSHSPDPVGFPSLDGNGKEKLDGNVATFFFLSKSRQNQPTTTKEACRVSGDFAILSRCAPTPKVESFSAS